MGQAKLKAARRLTKAARANTTRLQLVSLVGEFVTYNELGESIGRASNEKNPIYINEAFIPQAIRDIFRRSGYKFDVAPQATAEGPPHAAAKLAD